MAGRDRGALRDESWAVQRLREEWWLNHGCGFTALYGDDGEMQCHACHVDFKREPLDELYEFVCVKRAERTAKALLGGVAAARADEENTNDEKTDTRVAPSVPCVDGQDLPQSDHEPK